MKLSRFLSLLLILALVFSMGGCMLFGGDEITAQLNYVNGDTEIHDAMDFSETRYVIAVITGKKILDEAPEGIHFSKDVSIWLDGTTFAIADDGSGYIKMMEDNKYILLPYNELPVIDKVFKAHGVELYFNYDRP